MARLTVRLLKLKPPFVIAVDRTEWQLGKSWVNVLMLSIGYKGIAIPLFWLVLEEKGCSDNAERCALVQQFIDEFGVESIRFVTADREFASVEWLKFLVERKISFRLRIKANASITDKRGKRMRASKVCRTLKVGERREFRRERRLWNQVVFVAASRKADGDNVIVISSEQSGQILPEYGVRWQIETLFGCLKTRGFRLEDTHLTKAARVSKLLSLLTLACCWALLTGEFASQETPLKIKKHGRREKSVFRFGFDMLRNCFCQITTNFRQKQRFQQLTLLLSCT
jgi:transposase